MSKISSNEYEVVNYLVLKTLNILSKSVRGFELSAAGQHDATIAENIKRCLQATKVATEDSLKRRNYSERVAYWTRDQHKKDDFYEDTGAVVLIHVETSGSTKILTNVKLIDSREDHTVGLFRDEVSGKLYPLKLDEVVPMFLPYARGYGEWEFEDSNEMVAYIYSCLQKAEKHLRPKRAPQINGSVLLDGTPHKTAEAVGLKNESLTNLKTGTKPMSTLNKMSNTFSTQTKSSLELAGKITAGNAANTVVKQALRPILEPVIRKLIEPKGMFSKALGQGRVDETLNAIMDSPFMDIIAAAVLTGITSSGLIKNEKVLATSELAFDAATLKVFSLIDTDALLSGIVSKVNGLTTSLEALDKPSEK